MANKPFNTYFGERIEVSGAPPPAGDFYLVDRDGVVGKTTFGLTGGFAEFTDDAAPTVITTVDTWTPLNDVLVVGEITPNLVFANNTFTYVGADSIAPIPIRAAISCIKTQPGEMTYKVGIAINGNPVAPSMSVGVTDAQRSFVSTVWYSALLQNYTITMMIKNISGDHDLIVTDGQLSVG